MSVWIFQHGWGYDNRFWDQINSYIPEGTECQRLDRGYYGNPVPLIESASKQKVLVVHSFGLHLIPKTLFQEINVLIIFAGFLSFENSFLDLMLKQMKKDPLEVINQFHKRCSFPDKAMEQPISSKIDQVLLIEDLDQLKNNRFDVNLLAHIPKSVIIHGEKDRIVPLSMVEEFYQYLPQSKMIHVKNAGHSLPLTHAEWCYQTIHTISAE